MTLEQTQRGLDEANAWHGAAKDFNVRACVSARPLTHLQATNVVLINGDQDPFHTISMYNESWQHPGQRVLLLKGVWGRGMTGAETTM